MNLTKRQKEVYDFIGKFLDERGFVPSYVEIGRGIGATSPATVHKHINNLRKKGWIHKPFGGHREFELTRPGKNKTRPINELVRCPNCSHDFNPMSVSRI